MRVGRTRHPRFRQYISWRPPSRFTDSRGREAVIPNPVPRDMDPPEFFDLDDFPELSGEWREIDTWAFGGLGVFERETDPLDPVVTNGHRVGLEFENERYDMTGTALPLLVAFVGGVTYHTEFPYGWSDSAYARGSDGKGLTDIVVCEYDWSVYQKRQRTVGTNHLNDKWGYLKSYRYIRDRGPYTAEDWRVNGPYSERYAKEIWQHLSQKGFLATNGGFGGYFTVMPLPDHIEAHAIELKQSNWREALEQAQRAEYADYQWVALDAGHLKAARENADAFRDAGVGLVGIAEGGLVELVPAAERYPEPDAIDRMDLRERSVAELAPDDVEDPEPDEEAEEDDVVDEGPEQAALGNYA